MPDGGSPTPQTGIAQAHAALRTTLAEETLKRLAIRHADYKWVVDQRASTTVGRHLHWMDTRHENALVDAVAATEIFTGERLRLIDPTLTENDLFTWRKREMVWKQRGGTALADAGTLWTRLNGYIQIRNAIQHGFGRLTDFQLESKRRDAVLDEIRATGCQLDGDLIYLSRPDVDACFATCDLFVTWLDITSWAPSSSA